VPSTATVSAAASVPRSTLAAVTPAALRSGTRGCS
jgi:hypothetical protein